MNKLSRIVLVVFIGLGLSIPAQAALRVVATVPDLADIVRAVGGSHVDVTSLATGKEDIHAVPQRPSFLPLLNRADAIVLIGFELEHAFLPALLDVAQNPKIIRGRPGYIDCSKKITALEVPETLSRAEGDLHPHGNPHYNMDPRNGAAIAKTISEGLSALDPAHAKDYEMNRDRFVQELVRKLEEWAMLRRGVTCRSAVSHHADMVYFADYMGMRIVQTIEPKPGIPPTGKHLKQMAETIRLEGVPLILHEIQYSRNSAEWLSQQTGVKVADVATMGGAFPDSQTYFGMIEHNIRSVAEACQ